MKKNIKKLIVKVGRKVLIPIFRKWDQQTELLRLVAKSEMQTRAILKREQGAKINVVFVCHSPSLWGKQSPVFKALRLDPSFNVSLVAAPYRHATFGDNNFHDAGTADYIRREEGIEPIIGYDSTSDEWLDLQSLQPDYVFFQQPYDCIFPFSYTSECVSMYARICYVPYYGILIFNGVMEEVTHPLSFFKNVSLAFLGHEKEAEDILGRFCGTVRSSQLEIVGPPALDYVKHSKSPTGAHWNLEYTDKRTRILWTPRWRTEEGTCHFFDYNDYFVELAKRDESIDFLFRPHPLCFNNFLTTGELSQVDHDNMIEDYERLQNAAIDRSGVYEDTFLSCDILVSDMSSMMAEFFITGKPIVYTHREDTFNEFGSELAEGYYWVRNQQELEDVLSTLRRGEDPLKSKRQEIIERMFFIPEEGSASVIKNLLKERF